MMNWKCKEFKITKYDNENDYRNGKISSIETHHGNAITNNGLFAMWVFATTSNDTERENFKIDNKVVHPFKAFETSGTTGSIIAVGNGSTQVTGNETSLAQELASLKVTAITRTQIGDVSGSAAITFAAEAGAGVAAGNWNEWGIYDYYDTTSNEKGILFNRKVESMGTKSDTSVWLVEVTIELVRSSN